MVGAFFRVKLKQRSRSPEQIPYFSVLETMDELVAHATFAVGSVQQGTVGQWIGIVDTVQFVEAADYYLEVFVVPASAISRSNWYNSKLSTATSPEFAVSYGQPGENGGDNPTTAAPEDVTAAPTTPAPTTPVRHHR